jgi:ATP-dependent Lhr-like helicase
MLGGAVPLTGFHPAVARWFERTFAAPTEPQALAWPAIRRGEHVLIAAPTGAGKTLAAFLAALDALVRRGLEDPAGALPDTTSVVYVSPLKALSNDVHRNLELPLAGIAGELERAGLPPVEIRTLVRTGDTPASERAAMTRRPPHVLVTTPESLAILLTSDGGRRLLATAGTAIVDEIHAVAGSKRGSHLALSLARLEALVEAESAGRRRLTRIGLSATQKPIEEVARFLVGTGEEGAPPPCTIVDVGHRRDLDLGVEVPDSPLAAVMANEVWEEVYDRLAELIHGHRTTLVFVNTRRTAERATRHLEERLGAGAVTSHHGSLARERRLDAEQRLKAGGLRALVATSSLELGIDVGDVDLVCQLGTTHGIAPLLQRVGRSGHRLSATPKGRVFPLSRDELVEAAALLDAVRRGELDRLEIPEAPLDILAQTIVAEVGAAEEVREDDLFRMVRRAWPYRGLPRATFDEVVAMLVAGYTTRVGRRGAYLHHDAVNGVLRARRGARLTAITSGGAIPDTADYDVVLEPAGAKVGTVHEDFAVESIPGDVFQLGNASWRILRVEQGKVRVEDAAGQPPTIPFWLGEAPGRTRELSEAVSRLRARVDGILAAAPDPAAGVRAAAEALESDPGLPREAAAQLAAYLAAARASLGLIPTREKLVLERFFDSAGDHHLVLHAPFGSRVNRAWGLALRKRFCRKFNFELQAAATEDAVLLSLGPSHSFPLEEVFAYLKSASVREILVQALLDAPMFGVRWRWNASRALALPRFRGGRKVPPPLLRQAAEDLVAVVFPDQLACLETIAGDREVPDHPLVRETLRDCLEEAMDVGELEGVLSRLEAGAIEAVARDLPEPSALAHEIVNARPWAFLDDAPLEERRTQAVLTRRWLDPEGADDLGRLDPEAIERVREEAAPAAESAEELHDALTVHGWLPAADGEARGRTGWLDELAAAGRAAVLRPEAGPAASFGTAGGETAGRRSGEPAGAAATGEPAGSGPRLWVAAERLPQLAAVFPGAALEPPIAPPARAAGETWEPEAALVELVRGRLEALGPVTAAALAAEAGLAVPRVDAALAALEGEGFVLRGHFSPGLHGPNLPGGAVEWCERRLLARVHRRTLDRLRREIRPVSRADYARFLLGWQRVEPEDRGEGIDALAAALDQLEGFAAPAAAWEADLLPARVADYDPAWLDALCLSGRYVWLRLSPPATNGGGSAMRTTPIALVRRESLPHFREIAGAAEELPLGAEAEAVRAVLAARGACFFGDLAREAGLLHAQTENALGELVARGLVTADSFAGLRALLVPSNKRPKRAGQDGARGRRAALAPALDVERAGRWSLLPPPPRPEGLAPWETVSRDAVETAAWALLRRWGVVFRRLLDREPAAPPWRELLRVLHRLEARGEIRGGRFVDGFSGEQFALPEAIGKLRAARREAHLAARGKGPAAPEAVSGALLSVSGADPLNLLGVVIPGDRLPALAGNRLLYKNGTLRAVKESGEVRFLPIAGDRPTADADPAERWQAEQALRRRPVPPRLRPYLGYSA